MNPLGPRRYTDLVDKLSFTLSLIQNYLELKINKLQGETMNPDQPYIKIPELRRARREAIKEHGRQGLTEAINNAKIRLGATGEPDDNVEIVAHHNTMRELVINPKMGWTRMGLVLTIYNHEEGSTEKISFVEFMMRFNNEHMSDAVYSIESVTYEIDYDINGKEVKNG